MLQNAGIGASAARRAAFDFQLRELRFQIVEQPVAGFRLLMQAVSAVVHRLGDVTIVIPLDVVDAELLDQRRHLPAHMLVGGRIGQIKHILGAVGDVFTVRHRFRRGENPIRMLAGAVGIEVHHFRLEPQAELHAKVVHMLSEIVETVRPDFRIDHPIAEAPGVVTTFVKPAIVKHETFDANACGTVGQLDERGFVMVEIHRFPRVDGERTRA